MKVYTWGVEGYEERSPREWEIFLLMYTRKPRAAPLDAACEDSVIYQDLSAIGRVPDRLVVGREKYGRWFVADMTAPPMNGFMLQSRGKTILSDRCLVAMDRDLLLAAVRPPYRDKVALLMDLIEAPP